LLGIVLSNGFIVVDLVDVLKKGKLYYEWVFVCVYFKTIVLVLIKYVKFSFLLVCLVLLSLK